MNENYMPDSQGRLVPIDQVKPIDKLRDQTVRSVVQKAKVMRSIIDEFKDAVRSEIFTFIELSMEQYGCSYGGKKGNFQLMSFDGKYKIQIAISEGIVFDERLNAAKELIDSCIHRWSDGARSEIKTLISDAFYVDKTGKMNVQRVLGLRRLDISDPQWQNAMKAISDSIFITGSKQYLRLYERNEPDGAYSQLSLDFSAL